MPVEEIESMGIVSLSRSLKADVEPLPGIRLKRRLGKGGSGEVWEALSSDGVPKAVKFTSIRHRAAAAIEQELSHLKTIRSIKHPFLVQIDHVEVVDESLVMVMELAERSLVDRFAERVNLGKRGISRDELLDYLSQTAEVLDLLSNRHDLHHFDIKPSNLLLSHGQIKVSDFGLVQVRTSGEDEGLQTFSPGYAPPEFLEGAIDATADQYALAVTYQEMLTGQRPFRATSILELADQQRYESPHVALLPSNDQIILGRALHADPTQRFGSCSEFVQALRASDEYVNDLTESKLHRHIAPPPGSGVAPGEHTGRNPGKSGLILHLGSNANMTPSPGPHTRPAHEEPTPKPEHEEDEENRHEVRATFTAALPMEMYALKLRAFIDLFGAEVVEATPERSVLQLRPKSFLGLRSPKALYARIETLHKQDSKRFSVVDICIWSAAKKLRDEELMTRGAYLIRALKSFFMATDEKVSFNFESRDVRNELWK
ncbi:Serine/threonine-protein kinase pkn6 [Planctomycetes bacterium Pan216]|uniref:Serine/threonine-protein kinase pkn6 n=1 Tax=Kolteria novifilia TaxID=2527975 RepID=A0A518B5J2_9BACT|nr:Serine/threonine-protein kinase pkn6 [Planctomycetes bacterium Pan216]